MARPSDPVHYLFRFHIHGRPKDEWRELQFKWKLTLDAATAKVQRMIQARYGQYDTIDGFVLKPPPGYSASGALPQWQNVRNVWWFPANRQAPDGQPLQHRRDAP